MADNDAHDQGGTTEPQDTNPTDNGDTRNQRDATDGRDQSTQEPDQKTKDDGKTFTQADVDRLIADRINRERKKFDGHDDLKKKAAKFDELEAAKKSEVEKLNDQLTAAQVELQGFKVAEIRRSAADEAGLPAKYAKFITAADEAEALEQAKELAEGLKRDEPKRVDLKQGTRTTAPQPASRDELLRGLAGYGR